jgi:two-component system sensor histidine kinase KdpD
LARLSSELSTEAGETGLRPGAAGPGTLLVCVMADRQAEDLVEQAVQMSRSQNIPLRVVHLETMASRQASRDIRTSLTRALQRAGQAHAEVLRLSLDIDSASRVVLTVVQQAQSMGATHILIGNLAMGRRYWLDTGERISDFSETLIALLPNARIHILASPGRDVALKPAPHPAQRDADAATLQTLGTVTGVLALCTAAGALIAPWLHPINLSLIYMAGVFYVALRRGLGAALATMLVGLLLFDWIFVEPRWSLKPTDPQYFFTFLITLIVGIAISRLGSQSRQTALHAMVMAQQSQSLSLLSQNLARTLTLDEIVDTVVNSIKRDLGARARILLLDADGRPPRDDADPEARLSAAHALRGDPTGPESRGFVLSVGGTPLGVLLVDGPAVLQLGASEEHLLQAYANQAAIAIERCQFARRSEQAAVAIETERLRNTLLAGISHDFRTPLTAIIGAASAVLSQERITLEQRNALAKTVLDQATRLQSLTSDLLDLARLQEGQVRLQTEWCPLEDLVHDATATVAAALRQHELQLELVPAEVVWCDATLMAQALSNLLLNAAQHSPRGGRIEVRIAVEPGWWTLRVRDQGPGLKPGSEEEVFRKFYREAHDAKSGTGLGLAICEVVAKLHGGRIDARSDGGAVFQLTLPQPERSPDLEQALHG